MKQPMGRPPCSAQWNGEQWIFAPGAAERAAQKLVANREKCRDRRRATKEELRKLHPELFEKKKFKETLPAMMEKLEQQFQSTAKVNNFKFEGKNGDLPLLVSTKTP